MIPRKEGKVINILSSGGKIGVANGVFFCATKAAVTVFTRSLAREVPALGINVNSVALGSANTSLFVAYLLVRLNVS